MRKAKKMKLEAPRDETPLATWARLGATTALCLGLVASCSRQEEKKPEVVPTNPPAVISKPNSVEVQAPVRQTQTEAQDSAPVLSPAPPAEAIAPAAVARPEPSPLTRQLMANLEHFDPAHGPLTPEQAAAWKQSFKQLTDLGAAAVPAIREFLEKNTDINLGALGGSQLIGLSSLRLVMMEALQNIGGTDATAALLQILQTTADPTEVATLARLLEKSEPEKYRAAVVNAAQESLALAASGQWDGREVSPLFEVLKLYGGAAAATDLERYANTWFDYTPLALAQMPDGAGITSLIRLAQNADGKVTLGQDMYQRVLAQAAAQYQAAADALLEQTRANRIEVSAWPGVADALAGNTLHLAKTVLEPSVSEPNLRAYHVSVGNQNYLEAPPSPTMGVEQINARIQLVESMLGVTSNPAAIEALKGARNSLSTRLSAAK